MRGAVLSYMRKNEGKWFTRTQVAKAVGLNRNTALKDLNALFARGHLAVFVRGVTIYFTFISDSGVAPVLKGVPCFCIYCGHELDTLNGRRKWHDSCLTERLDEYVKKIGRTPPAGSTLYQRVMATFHKHPEKVLEEAV